ncbi:MAG: transmembrane protein 93 [Piptocephalis tieghemiana]|nr:MAG: transmembrane protein 93 [Piptocephalis tieghemiana]
MSTTVPKVVEAHLASNSQTLDRTRSFFSFASGAAAGILGLRSANGFYFFALTYLLHTTGLHLLHAKGKPSLYFRSSKDLLLEGLPSALLSYVLFWTLLYGIVHVYD